MRSGSPLEFLKKALNRKSYGSFCANDAKKGLVVCDGEKAKRGPGEGSGTRPGDSSEKNDSWFHLRMIWLENPGSKTSFRGFD